MRKNKMEVLKSDKLNFLLEEVLKNSVFSDPQAIREYLNKYNIKPYTLFTAEDALPIVDESMRDGATETSGNYAKDFFEDALAMVKLSEEQNKPIHYVSNENTGLVLYFVESFEEIKKQLIDANAKMANELLREMVSVSREPLLNEIETLKTELSRYKTAVKNAITKKAPEELKEEEKEVQPDFSSELNKLKELAEKLEYFAKSNSFHDNPPAHIKDLLSQKIYESFKAPSETPLQDLIVKLSNLLPAISDEMSFEELEKTQGIIKKYNEATKIVYPPAPTFKRVQNDKEQFEEMKKSFNAPHLPLKGVVDLGGGHGYYKIQESDGICLMEPTKVEDAPSTEPSYKVDKNFTSFRRVSAEDEDLYDEKE